MTEADLLQKLSAANYKVVDRAVALLWFRSRENHMYSATALELSSAITAAGYAKPNPSRLNLDLSKDRRTSKDGIRHRINISAREGLDSVLQPLVGRSAIKPSDSILPRELVAGTRGYIEKVTLQINASFDAALYDCCAVMCRRLLETLIIEVYEHRGIATELKNGDGHFKMFAGLLAHIEKESRFNVGRGALKGLRDFKGLGDNAAHNRRFNATRIDIEGQKGGMRLAVEELLHLAGLK